LVAYNADAIAYSRAKLCTSQRIGERSWGHLV